MFIAITGGCGYVGSVLVEQLAALKKNFRVDLLDLKAPAPELRARLQLSSPNSPFHFHRMDVSDPKALSLVARQYDAIIHLAALVGYPACKADPEMAHRANVKTAETVLQCKRPQTPVLFTSTISVYGDQPADKVVDESSATRPNSIYGETKKKAESLFLEAGNNVVFRFAGSFGRSPTMRHDVLIHDFVKRAASGEKLSIYESHFVRQFIHVRDMVGALIFVLERIDALGGQVFNVGNPNVEITKRDLAEAIAKQHSFLYSFENSGTDLEKRNYPISFQKLIEAGYRPLVGLNAGIAELLEYYLGAQQKERSHVG